MRIAVVGISDRSPCGVRAYARQLTEHLRDAGMDVREYWMFRQPAGSFAHERQVLRSWSADLECSLSDETPDVILLHYSVFAFSYRGIPLFVPSVLRSMTRVARPTLVVLHEYVYPFHLSGVRGFVWAISQRLALPLVLVRASSAIVTTETRLHELARWYPRRPIQFLPVPSNVPVEPTQSDTEAAPGVVGLFGYAGDGVAREIIVEAVARASSGIGPLELRLIGSPGPDSRAGREWRGSAERWGVGMEFTGVLDSADLSRAIATSCVMVFGDEIGPTPRKTTLAASLAHGKAIVAIDGPQTWSELRDDDVVCLQPATSDALAGALRLLVRDADWRHGYEQRARQFYDSTMAAEVVAARLASVVTKLSAN